MYTIGFVGSHKNEVADLFTKFVIKITEIGKQKDQEHPPAVVCGIDAKTPQSRMNNFLIAKELGAKIIVSSDALEDEEVEKIKEQVGQGITILHPKTKNIESLLEEVTTKSFEDTASSHLRHGGFKHLGDKKSWHQSDQGRKLLKLSEYTHNAVGVIGGAGVMTGANFALDLSRRDQEFLMLSDSAAPDKNNAIMIGGDNFAPDYLRDVTILSSLTSHLAIPCNTAHIKKSEFCGALLDEEGERFARLVDIGDATLNKFRDLYPQQKRLIILGTPATLTNPDSPYSPGKLFSFGIEAIKPNDDQLQRIYRAIYKVKGFQSDEAIDAYRRNEDISEFTTKEIEYEKLKIEAKELISGVVKEIREQNGGEMIPVVLGCTEFPVVFTQKEMADFGLISSSDALAEEAKKKILSKNGDRKRKMEASPIRQSTGEIYRVTNGWSPHSDSPSDRDEDSDLDPDDEFSLRTVLDKYDLRVTDDSKKLRIFFKPKDEAADKSKCYMDIQRFYEHFHFTRADKVEKHFQDLHCSIPKNLEQRISKLENWFKEKHIGITKVQSTQQRH